MYLGYRVGPDGKTRNRLSADEEYLDMPNHVVRAWGRTQMPLSW
jgi:hypothetical protein